MTNPKPSAPGRRRKDRRAAMIKALAATMAVIMLGPPPCLG